MQSQAILKLTESGAYEIRHADSLLWELPGFFRLRTEAGAR